MTIITIAVVLLMLLASFIWWRAITRVTNPVYSPSTGMYIPQRHVARRAIIITALYAGIILLLSVIWSAFAQLTWGMP